MFQVWRTGLFATSPVSPGSEGRSGPRRAFAVCVPVAGADVQDRRGVLPVRLDMSDDGLGTALPFPGVARLPEADASRPGGRSVAIEHGRETCVRRVSVEATTAFAVSLRGSRPTSLPTDGTGVVTL